MSILPFVTAGNFTITQISDPNTANLVYATFTIAIITAIGIGITSWLTRSSLTETRKSNQLTRIEIETRLKPILRVHNTGVEPRNTNSPDYNPEIIQYHPNLRNDGTVEASHFRINYKVMEREVDLEEIVKQEKEIEKRGIPYDASILPNGIAVLNALNLTPTDKRISVVLWINYKFLDDIEDTIIFNIIFNTYGENFINSLVKHYTVSDIKHAREEIKIKERGMPF